MPRKARETSKTGIYHVLFVGTNGQDIFNDQADYCFFLKLLQQQTFPEDKQGNELPSRCILYAYCLMPNHVHLLIRTTEYGLTSPVSGLTISYAQYYNKKYNRYGSLFQDRYKSEPVNDMAFFITLLRYIHQVPVITGIAKHVASYTWSSWCEYDSEKSCEVPVCQPDHVRSLMPLEKLTALIKDPLPENLDILNFNNGNSVKISDEMVSEILTSLCGNSSFTTIQQNNKEVRNAIIRQLRYFGASIRQIARLTGISPSQVRNISIKEE